MIDESIVKHIAKLARIELTDAEIKKFSTQLDGIFEYMNILKEVNVDGVKETSQVTGLVSIMDEDEIRKSPASREDLLACSELEKEGDQVKVPRAVKN